MTSESLSRMTSNAAEAAGGAMRTVEREARDAIDAAAETGREARGRVEGTISSHPLAAIGVAAGVGYLLGALASRR